MKPYSILLFDLDGTLQDSAPGITKSVQFAMKKWGRNIPLRELQGFVGPPLSWSFPHYFGLGEADTREAIRLFRTYYREHGVTDATLYDGIYDALATLKKRGYRLAIATSKPAVFLPRITAAFGIADFFEVIAGASPDDTGTKAEVVAEALSRLGNPDPATVLMIGDREHDIEGARANGVKTAGVLWGYGSREEFCTHGAAHIFESVADMLAFLPA